MLGWLVYEHGIEPHVTVFDKSARTDGIFSREDFTYDHAGDVYRCPGGKVLTTTGTLVNDGATMLYLASKRDCDRCALKSRCCPKQASRKVPRSIYEGARDMARQISSTKTLITFSRIAFCAPLNSVNFQATNVPQFMKTRRCRRSGYTGIAIRV